ITLSGQDIPIILPITIDGGNKVTISGGGLSRIFSVLEGNCGFGCITFGALTLRSITLTGGVSKGGSGAPGSGGGGGGGAGLGGAVYVAPGASLAATNVVFSGNQAIGGSGGLGSGILTQGMFLVGGTGGAVTAGDTTTSFLDVLHPPTLYPLSGNNGSSGSLGTGPVGPTGKTGSSVAGPGSPAGFAGANNGPNAGGGAGLGGAIYVEGYAYNIGSGSASLNGVTFTGNSALPGAGAFPGEGKGGAIYSAGIVTNYGATFTGNSAASAGTGYLCSAALGQSALDNNDICGTITDVPDLSITKAHTGNFMQGQLGATYTLAVSNAGPGPSSGQTTVTEKIPAGLTLKSMAGAGWTCPSGQSYCSRADTLPQGSSFSPITVTVDVAANAPASVVNTATVAGSTGTEINTANNTASDPTTIQPVTISVVVTANPLGATVTVDGQSYFTPRTFAWIPGSTHTLGAPSPQSQAVGTRYVFQSWFGTNTTTVAPTVDSDYVALFTTQYQLQTSVFPVASGTMTPASGNYYNDGATVNLKATAAAGYAFSSWSGNVASASNPATQIVMTAPESVTAMFHPATSLQSVVVTTNPPNLGITVDGLTSTAPQTFQWPQGSAHTLSVSSPQSGSWGVRYLFTSWSQGGAQTQTVTVNAPATYTANFNTEYLLETFAQPAGTGSVTPSPGGWYPAGTSVPIQAVAASGYVFLGWAGSLDPNASTTVVLNHPWSAIAVFAQPIQSSQFPYRVNAGDFSDYNDPAGNLWHASPGIAWFFAELGPFASGGGLIVAETNTPDLYQSEETSSESPMEFRAPVPNGTYQVKLKLADLGDMTPTVFNLSVNGQPALLNFDRHYVANSYEQASSSAYDEFVTANVTTGMLVLHWDPLPQQQAAINAIEIMPASIRVKAGGGPYTAPDGTVWGADTTLGGTILYATTNINGTSTPALYSTEKASSTPLEYDFPVANGTYIVRLKFAELQYQSAGQRVFNVWLNGWMDLYHFDPFAAGGFSTAVDKVAAITVTNETLSIRFEPVLGMAAIAAIEILPSTDIRVKAGSPGIIDFSFFSGNTGVLWLGDHNYSAGQTFTTTMPISGVSGDFLYESVRYNSGPLDYSFLVPNGQYYVILKFAEIQNPVGGNTFNVAINGTQVLANFNALTAAGGAFKAIDQYFKTTVSGNALTIHFDGQPEIAGIEIHSLLPDGLWEPAPIVAPNPPVVIP
ncbi:MAG TPA: malectin domain-containing carbohydrate-binding protein, partial [Candidatus Sulfopaludibacter sp.]|nr:malectin domain-containing carbohydrate-binding protein [Candidatus Sulfopaludibacter sp.]